MAVARRGRAACAQRRVPGHVDRDVPFGPGRARAEGRRCRRDDRRGGRSSSYCGTAARRPWPPGAGLSKGSNQAYASGGIAVARWPWSKATRENERDGRHRDGFFHGSLKPPAWVALFGGIDGLKHAAEEKNMPRGDIEDAARRRHHRRRHRAAAHHAHAAEVLLRRHRRPRA